MSEARNGGGIKSGTDVSRETKDRFETNVSHETSDRFETYVRLILRWTAKINLISRHDATEAGVWQRHIVDSLQLLPLITEGVDRAVDLGSGGGLPGLVLAIARPDVHFTLIESDRRKAAFLQIAVAELGIEAEVLPVRIEQAKVAPAQLVTARALAPLPDLLAYATPFLAPGGTCLFLKGRSVDDELTSAARDWHMKVEKFASRTDGEAALLRISELRSAA